LSDRGFFAVDRGVWDHPLFVRERFSEREAWLWLISSAAWEPTTVRIGRSKFDLKRGQCAFSLRFLAEKWMWSEPKVRRFLKRLSTDARSDAQPDAPTDAAVLVLATREATQITICNYDDYQLSRRTSVSQSDAPTDALALLKPTNPRRKEEETNKQDAAAAAPEVELFRRGREVLGKDAGGLINKLLAAKQKNIALARAAIEQASTKDKPREYIGAVIRKQQTDQPNWLDGIPGVI
jgi:hypothetical protein